MCFPTVLAGIGLAATGAGVYAEALGARRQQQAENDALEYNAMMSERNVAIAQQQASEEIKQSERRQEQLRRLGSQRAGQQRSALAASGVVVDQGTGLTLQEQLAANNAIDVLLEGDIGRKRAYGFEVEASQSQARAQQFRQRKGDPSTAFRGTLLSGIPSVLQAGVGFANTL